MTIRAVLAVKGRDIVSVPGDTAVGDAAALLAERRIGAVPVIGEEGIAGIFSERDIVHGLAEHGAALFALPVRAVMSAPAITIGEDDSVLAALSLMTQRRIRHLPVTAQGRIVGMVSIGDLVKHRIAHIEREAEAMRSYIQG